MTADRPLLEILVAGRNAVSAAITTTPGHPFWVDGVGWVHAAELTDRDLLHRVSIVDSLEHRFMSHRVLLEVAPVIKRDEPNRLGSVYNLTVADFHTYFVGDSAVLVHNASPCWSRTPKSVQDKMTLDAAKEGGGQKIIDNLGDPQFKGMEKWELKVKSADGKDSVVHYVRDPKTNDLMDFKFKKHSTQGSGNWASKPGP